MPSGEDLDRYQQVAERRWPAVRRSFNFPLLRTVEVTETAERTGPVSWDPERISLSATHIQHLTRAGWELPALIEVLLQHEVGHYALFPRELVHHLRYLERAETTFGEGIGYRYYALYADTVTELELLRSGIGDATVLDHRLDATAADTADDLPDPAAEARERVGRIMVGLYQSTFEGLDERVVLAGREAAVRGRLLELEYFTDDPAVHEANVVRYGEAIRSAVGDLPESALLGVRAPEDRAKGSAERPFGGADVATVPEAHLDRALTDAAAADQWTYERLAAFLEGKAGVADLRDETEAGAAGLARGAIERFDDLIGFYRRRAAALPLFLTRTEQDRDETARYRSGRRRFEAGDPLHRVNPFASFGLFGVPGVSMVDRYDEGVEVQPEPGIPDLVLGLDSSGSMPAPDEESIAITAAFVIARTYYRNGAAVGGYNFSGGVAFSPPSRDLQALSPLLCARWGGGTVLDSRALTSFIERMAVLDGIEVSDPDTHERVLDRELRGEDGVEAWSGPAGFDHVLLTDGEIANEPGLVALLEQLGNAGIRTFLFLTAETHADRWLDRDVPNTWVYPTPSETALTDRVLGLTREVVNEADPPAGGLRD